MKLENKTLKKVNELNDNLYFSYELEKPFMELAEELKKRNRTFKRYKTNLF